MKTSIITLSAILSLISGLFAGPTGHADLKQFTDAEVTQAATTEALESQKDKTTIQKLQSPISIKSLDEATKHFNRATLENIAEEVDFETQEVLLFVWQGSGQDRLAASVLESSPIQVKFNYTMGRTKDLKTHVAAYAKPINAKWSVAPRRIVFRCGVGEAGVQPQNHPVRPPIVEVEGQNVDGIQLRIMPKQLEAE